VKQDVKNTIPVYDICALADTLHMREDITAEGFAHYLARHTDLRFPHRHSFYHLVYFTTGSGSHTIDFETFKVEAGQIYFMVPGQLHSWHFKGNIDGYILNISDHLLHSAIKDNMNIEQFPFLSGVAASSVVQLQQSRPDVEQLLQQIVDEAAGNAPLGMEMIRLHLGALLIYTLRDLPATTTSKPLVPDTLTNFRKLVDRHYATKHLPKEYATMLYITPNHLNALCNNMLGMPAGEVIRQRILLEAKRMLAGTTISVSEISWELNFKDNSYFTKFFKKYAGTTPEQFRESAKAKTK